MVGMKINKKGWIRIVEATIAVLIVIGFVLTYSAKIERAENDLTYVGTPILEEMAENGAMRVLIISYTPDATRSIDIQSNNNIISQLNSFVSERITDNSLETAVAVCKIDASCILENPPSDAMGDIFAVERTISATPVESKFSPKKVKIFIWQKG